MGINLRRRCSPVKVGGIVGGEPISGGDGQRVAEGVSLLSSSNGKRGANISCSVLKWMNEGSYLYNNDRISMLNANLPGMRLLASCYSVADCVRCYQYPKSLAPGRIL